MSPHDLAVVLKRFEQADEVRPMEKGRFELVRVGGLSIGRATYEPGWRWEKHVGPGVGKKRCDVEHVGLVLSGTCAVSFADGREVLLGPGTSSMCRPYTGPPPASAAPRRIGAVSTRMS